MAKKFFRSFALALLPLLGSLLIRFLYATNKKNFHGPQTITEEPVIFACWHGELLMIPHLYRHYRKIARAKVLISNHFDGKFISSIVGYFGLKTLAGSTNRNAVRVLIQSIRALQEGFDIGITPDGPKGPRHEVADGIIVMAQKANAKIVLVEIKPTKYWQFNSWDKFVVPKPFGTINYYVKDEVDVTSMGLEEARAFIKEGLLKHEE